jgi:hypothetical protein
MGRVHDVVIARNVTVGGTPTRAAITDVQLRVVDKANGERVRRQVNGIALVAEPVAIRMIGTKRRLVFASAPAGR